MEGQKSLEMGWSGSENLLQEDEVFNELPLLDFRYPGSSGINYDLDATYQMDNLSGVPIHSSMDVLPDPTMTYEGDLSAGQNSEFGFPNQEFATMNSLNFLDQGMPETSFSSLLTQGMNSLRFPGQEMSGMSFSSLPSQELNSLSFPGQGMSELSFSNFPTQELNSLSFPSQDMSGTSFLSFPTHEVNPLSLPNQELSMMDILSFPTQGLNSLSLPSQELSMMDTLSFPTQETLMNTLEFSNQGLSMMDTLGLPTQEAFMNTLEFPNQGVSMMDTLSLPTQEAYMNTLEFPTQIPPVTMAMENIRDKGKTKMVGSSGYGPSQEELDPNDGNDNGNGGSELNLPLRSTLSKEMISQYFYMPIADAAKALNIGVTLLKRRCRELGISRWPQRKLTSIQNLINNAQELGQSPGHGVERELQEAIMRLKNEKKQIEETLDLQFEDDTIRLRQVCNKALHKNRKQSDCGH